MTRHFVRRIGTFRFAALSVAIVALAPVLVSLAQGRKGDQSVAAVAGVPSVSAEGLRGKRAAVAAPASGSVSFLPAVTYDSGGAGAASVAVADVNGDGKPDLLIANNYNCYSSDCDTNGTVAVLLGNGDGTFQPAVSYSSGGLYAVSVAVADVNGDGKPDLIVANQDATNCQSCANGSIGVLLGNGDGTFQPVVAFPLSGSAGGVPETVAVADLSGNGKQDLVAVLYGSQVNVLMGNGDGTFQPAVIYGLGCCNKSSLAIADVNRDGKPDLLLVFAFCNGCQGGGGQVGVMLGNGDGTFLPQVLYGSGGDYPLSIVVADVNGDGKADLVVGNSCSVSSGGYCSGPGSVGVLFGNGDGTFQAAVSYNSAVLSYFSVAVADVNGDGKPDLLAGGCASTGSGGPVYCGGTADGSLASLIGNGDGTFQPAVLFDAGGYWPSSIAVADLSGNGRPAVAVASWRGDAESGYDGSVGVLLNSSGSSAPTTITLASSGSPSVFGQAVLFTAAVSASSGTPTGTVIFYDGSTVIGSAGLANGSAVISVSTLVVGSQSITAAYQGSSNFGASTSVAINQVVNPASTATSLTSSLNPARINQTVTYSAVVASQDGGAATGTVTFQDGGATVAVVGVSSNQAAYSTSYAATGTHVITATYSGDGNNRGSASSPLSEEIDGTPVRSKTTVVTSGSPSLVGQTVTFTATVTSAYGAIPDGELVTFHMDGRVIGTGTTAGGVATCATSSLKATEGDIVATYAGDAKFSPSSGGVRQLVQLAPTTTSLVSSPNPSLREQPVTFTAQVTTTGPRNPSGRVTFVGGTPRSTTVYLVDGVATLTRSMANSASITAEYSGDDGFNAKSVSQPVNQEVGPLWPTTVTLASSLNPSTYGQAVTITATVSSASPTPPEGVVKLDGAGGVDGVYALNNGVATLTTSRMYTGGHRITAHYNGGASWAKSWAEPLEQGVGQDPTTTSIVSSPNPSVWGQPVTITVNVATPAGLPGAERGSLELFADGKRLAVRKFEQSPVKITTTALPAGAVTITASYGGTELFSGSTGSASQTVNPLSTVTTMRSSKNPSVQGESVAFIAKVTSSTGAVAKGTVTFTAGATTLGTVKLEEGTAKCETSALPAGLNTITATYNGGPEFTGSSASLAQEVQP